jgi:hypothetical protein
MFLVDFRQLGAHLSSPFWPELDSDSGFGVMEHKTADRSRLRSLSIPLLLLHRPLVTCREAMQMF